MSDPAIRLSDVLPPPATTQESVRDVDHNDGSDDESATDSDVVNETATSTKKRRRRRKRRSKAAAIPFTPLPPPPAPPGGFGLNNLGTEHFIAALKAKSVVTDDKTGLWRRKPATYANAQSELKVEEFAASADTFKSATEGSAPTSVAKEEALRPLTQASPPLPPPTAFAPNPPPFAPYAHPYAYSGSVTPYSLYPYQHFPSFPPHQGTAMPPSHLPPPPPHPSTPEYAAWAAHYHHFYMASAPSHGQHAPAAAAAASAAVGTGGGFYGGVSPPHVPFASYAMPPYQPYPQAQQNLPQAVGPFAPNPQHPHAMAPQHHTNTLPGYGGQQHAPAPFPAYGAYGAHAPAPYLSAPSASQPAPSQ